MTMILLLSHKIKLKQCTKWIFWLLKIFESITSIKSYKHCICKRVKFICYINMISIVLSMIFSFPFPNFFIFLFKFQMESICEDTVVVDKKQNLLNDFNPALRSGEWSDIGHRSYMEDTHICITDLAKKFGCNLFGEEAISFYGVSSFTFFMIFKFIRPH